MTRQPATRQELGAQRFLARRMAHALVRRDVAMHDDPLRAQSVSFAVGCLLAVVAIAACGVMAMIRPRGVPNSVPIVMAAETGALYVRIDDVLHPALNLASARLIARSAVNPVATDEAAIARAVRGPMVGIPGAPTTIGAPVRGAAWTVCDDDRTVVAVGDPRLDGFDASRPVLVTPRGESMATTYLLYDGHRAEIDLRSTAVVRALRLDGVVPVPVSRTLLDVVPERPAIAVPSITGAGAVGPAALDGAPVGSVVRVQRAGASEHYVVLPDGIQAIGEVAADVIRFAYERHAKPVANVAPAAVAALPVVTGLPVASFPQHARTPVGDADGRAVCAEWRPGASTASSTTTVRNGDSSRVKVWEAATLAQADGDGPNVDAVVISGGASAYVRSVRIVGDEGTSGARFMVSDAGVLFGIHDDDAAKSLGLGPAPEAAPWPVLAHLPHGPELGTEAASVARDGIASPS
ncbi:MAG: type VII secretion protein EccB [Mycobacterium sp.]